jgi:ribosomal protein L19
MAKIKNYIYKQVFYLKVTKKKYNIKRGDIIKIYTINNNLKNKRIKTFSGICTLKRKAFFDTKVELKRELEGSYIKKSFYLYSPLISNVISSRSK